MLKALKQLVAGLVCATMGIVILLNPGVQGDFAGGAIALLGLLVTLRAFALLVRGGAPVGSSRGGPLGGSGSMDMGFSHRKVIMPRDSRPEPPFKL